MRELTMSEMNAVAGAGDNCPPARGNDFGGITDPRSLGDDLIDVYEGLVAFTSHVIERVANAFD